MNGYRNLALEAFKLVCDVMLIVFNNAVLFLLLCVRVAFFIFAVEQFSVCFYRMCKYYATV